MLAALPAAIEQQGAARFRDPLRGIRAFRHLAQSAGRIHRHDLVRPRHVLRPRGLRLRSHHAAHRHACSAGFRGHAGDHRGCCGHHRGDLRAAEGNLFRLRHARLSDADPLDHPVLVLFHRRRPGLARRHSAPRVPRHRPVEPCASLHRELRASGDRPSGHAPDRAVAVRLHVAHDPRQCDARPLPRHRRLAREADHLRPRGAVRLHRRHGDGAVRVGRLSRIRLLDDFGRGDFHQHARRRHDLPGTHRRHRAAAAAQRHRHAPDRVLRHRARDRHPVLRPRPEARA